MREGVKSKKPLVPAESSRNEASLPISSGKGKRAFARTAAHAFTHSPIDAFTPEGESFATRIVRWQAAHGRHDLPWQNTRDPYRIWLSEIMLQQTQVSTVIPYYARFVAGFAVVAALGAAPL